VLSSSIALRERVKLLRGESLGTPEGYATTWSARSHIEFASERDLAAAEKEQVLDLVYAFTQKRREAISFTER
jgi:hypothetical protein